MRLCSIASGSSGNCIYVGSDDTHVIVDAGISGRRIEDGLNRIGLKTEELDGILITHEHSDHISGLGVLARRYGIPMYATKGTIDAIKGISSLGSIPGELFEVIEADKPFEISGLNINPVRISHDAADPVAFRIGNGSKAIGVVSDLGKYNDYIVDSFFGVDALLLEANHDVNMLQVGRYPYQLKCRILGDKGHLSNESSGRLLCRLLHNDLKHVFLGHLSQENNLAELAYETVRLEVLMSDNDYKPEDFHIKVAPRDICSELVAV
ncbi:MAG: MBL fold metallo-hydrolase [Lachnospiraceae bacterium]|nr:MBL fold metallo-hydrolase [Lachnospiraceae bacterium]MBR6485803.1 MBL fold metallo-hydrolase [Lachnospiraceae bacterium]